MRYWRIHKIDNSLVFITNLNDNATKLTILFITKQSTKS